MSNLLLPEVIVYDDKGVTVALACCHDCKWSAAHRGGEPGEGRTFITRLAEEHRCTEGKLS